MRSARIIGLAAFAGIAACTAVAGIGGFEVDPCFGGKCDAGDGSPATDGPLDDGGPTIDVRIDVDEDACACPAGMTRLPNKLCALPSGSPRQFEQCAAPLKLPDDCPIGVAIQVCDEDVDAAFSYPNSACDGGQDYALPSVYVQLGKSHTGKWLSMVHNSFGIAAANTCIQAGTPCVTTDLATQGVTNTGASNGVIFAIPKHPDGGCEVFTFTTEPLVADQ